MSDYPFAETAAAYVAAGIAVIPCDGKRPLIAGFGKHRAPMSPDSIAQLIRKYGDANIAALPGISLGGLRCSDVDEPAIIRAAACRFGPTPLITSTPRNGAHLWYAGRCKSQNLRASEQLPIDIKSEGAIVLLPPSRTERGAYQFLVGGIADFGRLPPMRPGALRQHHVRTEGYRNNGLFDALRAIAHDFARDDFDSYITVARAINAKYAPPLDDGEAVRCAMWVWRYRLTRPKRSRWKINHSLTDNGILFDPALDDAAVRLLLVLHAAHDATGRDFPIVAKAMALKQTIPGWGRDRYLEARERLLRVGWLRLVRPHGPRRPALFRFAQAPEPTGAGGRGDRYWGGSAHP
jgi:hypothetical protein